MSTPTTMKGWSALALIYPVFQYRYSPCILVLSKSKLYLFQQNYGLGKQEDEWRGMQQGMDVDREQGTVSHHPGWPGPPPGARPVPIPPGLHPPQPPQVAIDFWPIKCYPFPNCRLCPIPPQQPPHSLFRLLHTVKTGVEVIPADLHSHHNR